MVIYSLPPLCTPVLCQRLHLFMIRNIFEKKENIYIWFGKLWGIASGTKGRGM